MSDGARRTVLCVESSEQSRRALAASLRDQADCAVARHVHDVVEHLRSEAWDAYVLDYWMPDWSGPLLCREIRKRDPHCPVIVCGTPTTRLSEDRAFSAGASAYLDEVDFASLGATLATLLAASQADSDRAEQDSECVLSRELDKCMRRLATSEPAPMPPDSLERTLRARTFRTFIDSGGTRAHFGRWWPKQIRDQWLIRAAARVLQ